MAKTNPPTEYRVLVGLNYGPTDKRAESGDVVSDLPPESVGWLVEQGHVRLLSDEDPVADENPLLEDGADPDVIAADLGDIDTPDLEV